MEELRTLTSDVYSTYDVWCDQCSAQECSASDPVAALEIAASEGWHIWMEGKRLRILCPKCNDLKDIREELSDYAHDTWSGWMKYMFGKGRFTVEGEFILPLGLVSRWMRQMNTPYAELSEAEKLSDQKEAARILAITVGG